MRRIALIVVTIGFLCVTAGLAQANPYHHGHGPYHHRGHYGPIIRSPIVVAPPVVVRPRVVYPPVYQYRYYDPWATGSFYYQGPRVSVGVGF